MDYRPSKRVVAYVTFPSWAIKVHYLFGIVPVNRFGAVNSIVGLDYSLEKVRLWGKSLWR